MEKEIITKERIKYELIERNKQKIGVYVALIIAIYCLLTYVAMALFLPLELFGKASLINFIISLIITACVYYHYGKKLRKIKSDQFKIREDNLTGYQEKEGSSSSKRHYKPFELHFASYGEFKIYDTETLYKWSDKIKMGDDGFMYTSNPGDRFYIITLDDKSILYLYPQKFFELK